MFYALHNSTSNALNINELKMTEVSVETCFTDLKVLSLSLNSWHAIVQKDEYELWVATQTLNILCQLLPNNSRWICPRTYCNRCKNIIINHSPAPLRWIVVLSWIPWSTFDWMKKEKNKIAKKCSEKKISLQFFPEHCSY